jgi:hypothetical protein
MLNVQLDRIEGIISSLRKEKKRILEGTKKLSNFGLVPLPMHSPDHDCAAHVMYLMPTPEDAARFANVFPAVIAGKTGRHTYTEWDQVLLGMGAAHPAMNPYNHPDNAQCRRTYSKTMCQRSLDILNRTIMVPTHPSHNDQEIEGIIHNIEVAAKVALGGMKATEARLRETTALDTQKFDMPSQDAAERI